MIHLIVGTKAQMVKIAPIMLELQNKDIPYNFIFTGQHQETMKALIDNFSTKDPDITLHKGEDITSIPAILIWMIRILWVTAFHRNHIFKNDKNGIVLVHGDTFSTLLGALMGKFCRLKVAHIESGLRSFNFLHPFPEEITRILTFALSDIYFCPGEWAIKNLANYQGEKHNTQFNTLLDSLRHVSTDFAPTKIYIPKEKFCVVTTHRFENVCNKNRFKRNIELIEFVANQMKCIFILHPITRRRLIQYNLYDRLANNSHIELTARYDYANFIQLLRCSEFVITDGGSNQEECFYLGKPCLLLRKKTERQEGLDANVVISEYNIDILKYFLKFYEQYKNPYLDDNISPSNIIVEKIKEYQ